MTTPLQGEYVGVPAETFLMNYLAPLVTAVPWQSAMAPKMWVAGAPKPYRAVRRITGGRSQYTDEPLMRVHTFAGSYTEAAAEAAKNDERVQVLVNYPGWGTTLPNGLVVNCDWAEITDAAHEEPYGAESVVTRFVSEYRFSLSLVPA